MPAAMSDAHKAALAQGRRQSRVVRNYLEALEGTRSRRGRPRAPERIADRIQAIDEALAAAEPMARVRLIQERLDLTAELSAGAAPNDLAELEAAFVEVAKPFADAKGITYPAWREVGVPAAVLARAGITRSS